MLLSSSNKTIFSIFQKSLAIPVISLFQKCLLY